MRPDVAPSPGTRAVRRRRILPAALFVAAATAGLGIIVGRWLDPISRASEWSGGAGFCDPAGISLVGAPIPAFTAVDQDGETVTDRQFHGTPWISDFIFTRCTASCPTLTARLVALQRRLAGVPVRFVSFSVDPEHDRPTVLKDYAVRWHGDSSRWRLLSTDRNTLARLGPVLGGAEDPGQTGGAFHSDRFALADGAGRLLGLYASSSPRDLDRLVRDVEAALAQ